MDRSGFRIKHFFSRKMEKESNTAFSVAEAVGDVIDVYSKDDDSEHGNPSDD